MVIAGNENVGGRLDALAAVQAAKATAGDVPVWSSGLVFRQELAAILLEK